MPEWVHPWSLKPLTFLEEGIRNFQETSLFFGETLLLGDLLITGALNGATYWTEMLNKKTNTYPSKN